MSISGWLFRWLSRRVFFFLLRNNLSFVLYKFDYFKASFFSNVARTSYILLYGYEFINNKRQKVDGIFQIRKGNDLWMKERRCKGCSKELQICNYEACSTSHETEKWHAVFVFFQCRVRSLYMIQIYVI